MLQPYRCLDETSPWRCSLVRAGIRLAVDVGSVRLGVAHCDRDARLASPLRMVPRGHGDVAAIAALAEADEAIEVVVGLPVGLSGTEGRAAGDARTFAAALARQVAPLPVRLVDERFTTVLAHNALRQAGADSRRRRPKVDSAAAALLLQGALDAERATGSPPGELVGAAAGGGR